MNETEFVYMSCSFWVINGFESVYSHILLKNCHGELFKVKVGEVRFTSFVKVKVIEMTCTCIFRVQLFLKEEFNLLKLKLQAWFITMVTNAFVVCWLIRVEWTRCYRCILFHSWVFNGLDINAELCSLNQKMICSLFLILCRVYDL